MPQVGKIAITSTTPKAIQPRGDQIPFDGRKFYPNAIDGLGGTERFDVSPALQTIFNSLVDECFRYSLHRVGAVYYNNEINWALILILK